MATVATVGVLCGLGWNGASGRGLELGRSVFVQAGDEVIPAKEARARQEAGALFLDARPLDFWRMSRIPGALPLPEDDFDRAFVKVEPQLRRNANIVVYCAGFGCDASHVVARKLRERGFPAVVLDDGLPAWEDAGYPVDSEGRS
jgi:rhodanese-related sulfurtransferase